jgi:hypothetical protein
MFNNFHLYLQINVLLHNVFNLYVLYIDNRNSFLHESSWIWIVSSRNM